MSNIESVVCARFSCICFVLLVVAYRSSVASNSRRPSSNWHGHSVSSRNWPQAQPSSQPALPLTPPPGSSKKGEQAEAPLEDAGVIDDDTSGDKLNCRNWEGIPVAEGSHYFPNDDFCHSCVCHAGFPVMCASVLCSAPDCEFFEKVARECCTYHCIEPPDHGGERNRNGTATHPPYSKTPTSGDSANLGLRLLASTITCFLVLALLLFMVHRLRQRRMLIMMRRLHAGRSEDEAYISPFDTLDLGMDFTPYDDPPPPYSPPKPPLSIPTGEAPPPYQETANMLNNNNDESLNDSALNNNNNNVDDVVPPSNDSSVQETVDDPLTTVPRMTDRYGLSISVAALNSDHSDIVVRLQSSVPELEDSGSRVMFPRRVANDDSRNGNTVPRSVLVRPQSAMVSGFLNRNGGPYQFSYYRPEEDECNVVDDQQTNRSRQCRSSDNEARADDMADSVLTCQQPVYPTANDVDAGPIQPPGYAVRSDSVTSQLSQFSICSETGERRRQMMMSGGCHDRRFANETAEADPWVRRDDIRHVTSHVDQPTEGNYNNNGGLSTPSPRYDAVVDTGLPIGQSDQKYIDPSPVVSPHGGPCVRRLKPRKPRPYSNPGVVPDCTTPDDTHRRRQRSAGRDELRDPASFTHYGFIDHPLVSDYPLLAHLAGECTGTSSPQALLREATALTHNHDYTLQPTSDKKVRHKKRRSRNSSGAKEVNGNPCSKSAAPQKRSCPNNNQTFHVLCKR